MEFSDFIDDIAVVFDEANVDLLSKDTEFRDLPGWSSLSTMTLLSVVKINYDRIISVADIAGCWTIEDIYNLVART